MAQKFINSVSHMYYMGSLLDAIQNWPENQPNDISININDSVDIIREKLISIY
ncbi:hypothetical protein [Winogradskyella wichelsiae]|uniref:hypothetical protein n=1 Tax=Winogradskyella wichelsiae TaxID=2697007 RepID=UPI003EF525C4